MIGKTVARWTTSPYPPQTRPSRPERSPFPGSPAADPPAPREVARQLRCRILDVKDPPALGDGSRRRGVEQERSHEHDAAARDGTRDLARARAPPRNVRCRDPPGKVRAGKDPQRAV